MSPRGVLLPGGAAAEACLLHADVYQVEVEIGSLLDGACVTDRATLFDSVVCPNGSDRASLSELNVSCSMRDIPCLPVSAAAAPAWLHVCSWLCGCVAEEQLHACSEQSPGVIGVVDRALDLPARRMPCLPAALPGMLLCHILGRDCSSTKRPERLPFPFPEC